MTENNDNVSPSFGDKLYNVINSCRNTLFVQGEMTQLTFQALTKYVEFINNEQEEEFTISYPIGYRPDFTTIEGTGKYSKEDLRNRYNFLSFNQLPINGVYQLVTATELMLNAIMFEVFQEYPFKIPNKRSIEVEHILNASNLQDIKVQLINQIINELSYKSPKDFAGEFNKTVGVNLLEEPAFHQFIELKATRDILIHNSGIANDIYVSKSGTMARVKSGVFLPVTIQYWLMRYETCLQITEILEKALHRIWPSQEFVRFKTQDIIQQKNDAVQEAIDNAEAVSEDDISLETETSDAEIASERQQEK